MVAMRNISRIVCLQFLVGFSARLFLLVIGSMALSAGLSTSSFASVDDERRYGFRPSYDVCFDNAGGITSIMLNCNGEEVSYQDKRLNTAYRSLMKILPPAKQQKIRQEERDWIRKRESICEEKEGSGTLADLDSAGCFLEETANQANKLENLLKENKNEQ